MNPIIKEMITKSKLISENIYSRMPHFLRKQPPMPLGRWNSIGIEDKKRLDIAVKANYDHCGPCGSEVQYHKNKDKNNKN
jgi:hypothetical protein